MAKSLDAKGTKKQRALAALLADCVEDDLDPFDWVLMRFYTLTRNIKPASRSKTADEALELAKWLTPYLVPRKRAVEVQLKGESTITLEIGSPEGEEDFTEDYESDEFRDLVEGG